MNDRVKAGIAWGFAVFGVVVLVTVLVYVTIVSSQVTGRINDERARNTLTACLEQNARNTNTKNKVKSLGFSTEGRTTTFLLIDALAPHQNCQALTAERVSQ